MSYVFLEHTSDILFESYGKTYEKALESGAKALFDVVANSELVEKKKEIKITVKAGTLEELTVKTLGELLSQMGINEYFFNSFRIDEFKKGKDGYSVKGTAEGDFLSYSLARTEVKAVTYHSLEVKKEKGNWVIRVLLDI